MNEEFEKQLMIQVRAQLLINWLAALKELLDIPFDEFSRFHRKIFSILVAELMNDGLRYVSLQKETYSKRHVKSLAEYFTTIYDNVTDLKNTLTDEEYFYLYHLRNCAAHIFPVGYDHIDLEGNVKEKAQAKMQTKSGRQLMRIDDIEALLAVVNIKYCCDDRLFLKHIYDIVSEALLPMFEKLSNLECYGFKK